MKSYNTPCLICHEKNNNSIYTALQRIKRICAPYQAKAEHTEKLNWDIHMRCPYGISCCSELSQNQNRCNAIIIRIENKMIDIAKTDNMLYRQILQNCRGYFPAVYMQLERMHALKTHIKNTYAVINEVLQEFNIPEIYYSVGQQIDDSICIEYNNKEWSVYEGYRGHKIHIRTFDSAYKAGCALFDSIVAGETTLQMMKNRLKERLLGSTEENS